MDRNVSDEAMAAELRRRGYTVTPPEVIDLPGNGRLIAPADLLNIPEVPDPIFDAMLREALGLPAEGVGPTPLPPPPPELIHEEPSDG